MEAGLVPDWGVEGDAYAGSGDRQLTLIDARARERIDGATDEIGLCYVRFQENLRIEGLDPGTLPAGTRLCIAEATLEITSALKRCFRECAIDRKQCSLRTHVAFCRVIVGGKIAKDDDVLVITP